MRRPVGILLLACAAADARDKRAADLQAKAAELSKSADGVWGAIVMSPDQVSDDDLEKLIEAYEKSADLYNDSLDIEEDAGVNGSLAILTRRLGKARFLQMVRHRARAPPAPAP
ncbi:MAG: hypothetical protein ACREID_09300, partial [Planctomycetota bacterium]